MKNTILFIFFIMSWGICSCDPKKTEEISYASDIEIPEDKEDSNTENMKIKIIVNSQEYILSLTDNVTAKAFTDLLPLTVNMQDLNRNEKYCSLPESLPAEAKNPSKINKGDVMLYGSNTLVIFYESFITSYSYTKIGTIDNPASLRQSLGNGSVNITFEKIILH